MANVLQLVPNKGWGGGEKCVYELSGAIGERGDNVYVVIPSCDILARKFSGFNVSVVPVRSPYDPAAVARLAGLIRKYRIDVVHVHIFKHAMVCLLARALFGLPVHIVMTRHLSRPAKKKLHYNWLYRHIDKIAFVSVCALNRFLSSAPRISNDKLAVIHNSISLPVTDPLPNPEVTEIKNGLKAGTVVIGFAGRIVREKGLETLFRALAKLKSESPVPFMLLIAGTGDPEYIGLLEKTVRESGLNEQVRFIGFVGDTIGFFKSVDMAVAPSLVEEACSLTILESMAASVPVVAADGSQREQLANGEEGILVDPREPERLQAALASLLEDETMRRKLGAAARRRFDREFAFPLYVEKVYSVLYENGKY